MTNLSLKRCQNNIICRELIKENPKLCYNCTMSTIEIVKLLRSSNYIFIAGNGGSCAEADHMASEFVTHGIPAISLMNTATITALANDYGYKHVFSRQLAVLAHSGDTVVGLSTSGKSKNILEMYKMAKKMGLTILDWPRSGKDTAQIQEYQLKLMHKVYKKLC